MIKTVNNLLVDAIFYNNTFLAYSVYIAVSKGIVAMMDDESKFYASDLPFDEIQQAIDKDSLLLKQNSIKLFMVRYGNDYALYLARSKQDAEQLHFRLFKEQAERIVEATHKKGTSVYDERTKKTMSFYDMQKQKISLPRFCGLMESKVR